jgi:hypothetical protein
LGDEKEPDTGKRPAEAPLEDEPVVKTQRRAVQGEELHQSREAQNSKPPLYVNPTSGFPIHDSSRGN